jgi:membrane-associated progesterone receptor component
MNATANTLFSQLKGNSNSTGQPSMIMNQLFFSTENPLNWALLAVLAYVVKSYAQSSPPAPIEAKHPEVLLFRNYSPVDLLPFDGNSKENGGRILMGVNGSVYDVTRGRSFYGPGK